MLGPRGSVVAIAVDADAVYWVEGEATINDGAVAAVPEGGGLTTVVAAGAPRRISTRHGACLGTFRAPAEVRSQ